MRRYVTTELGSLNIYKAIAFTESFTRWSFLSIENVLSSTNSYSAYHLSQKYMRDLEQIIN